MILPDTSHFTLCECSDGTPQPLTADGGTDVMAGYLGIDRDANQFVEVVFCYLSRIRKTAVRNALQKRIEAATQLIHPNIATVLESGTFSDPEEEGQENPYYVCEFVEGERLPDYLNRTKNLNRQLSTSLAMQLAEIIATMVDHPRLLSSIELEDFAVSLDQGQFLKLRLTDFGFDREETPKSDMQLATQWVRTIGIIHQRVLSGQSIPDSVEGINQLNGSGSPFGRLLKRIEKQSGAQAVRTLKGLKPHVLSASGLSESALNYLDPEFRSITRPCEAPTGPLQVLMTGGEKFEAVLNERFTRLHESSAFGFSPFRFPARLKSEHNEERDNESIKEKAARVTLTVLPPERLCGNQGTTDLNRKMCDTYMKAHPSALRTRSLLYESDFTLVVSERLSGVPLPTLLANRGSLSNLDALELLNQIDRAMTHFECSDFGFHDFNPWQIDLHFEESAPDELQKCLSRAPLANWPAWDVKIRVEKPTESMIESSRSPWRYLHTLMDGKAFPALAIWLTECDRFDWALTIGNEEREPLSWNRDVNKLMDSAIGFYDPESPKHRKKMLELLQDIHTKEQRALPQSIIPPPLPTQAHAALPGHEQSKETVVDDVITIVDPEVLTPAEP